MKKKKVYLIILLTLLNGRLFSQSRELSSVAMETDPMSTAFGARTISLILETKKLKHFSIFTNAVKADFPSWMDELLNPRNKNKGYDSEIRKGGGVGVDYFIEDNMSGLYFGLVNLLFEYKLSRLDKTTTATAHNIIPRVGFRKFFSSTSKFYVNPFVGFRYEHFIRSGSDLQGQRYDPAGLQPFATIHIGYHL
ncbi:MAG: hypothetical protein AAF843_15485 [Bacteroidota bacterium]